jgi:hypothetical protein
MSVTVKGILRNGQVILGEKPAGIVEGPVEVILSNLPTEPARVVGHIRRGMFSKPGIPKSTVADLEAAKREWDAERS